MLEKQIEEYRKMMVESAMTKGFVHPDTVRLSQELDRLIYEAMQ